MGRRWWLFNGVPWGEFARRADQLTCTAVIPAAKFLDDIERGLYLPSSSHKTYLAMSKAFQSQISTLVERVNTHGYSETLRMEGKVNVPQEKDLR